MITDLEFVQYINAKICHDLAGSLGAISNGVEFMEVDDPDAQKKALDLIRMSSNSVINKMELFREIYGIIRNPTIASIEEMKETCQLIIKNKNVNLEFFIPSSLPQECLPNTKTAQLALATLVLASSQLIYGGTLNITIHRHENHNSINIIAKGPNMKIKSDSHKIILGELNEPTMLFNNIEAYYIKRLTEELKNDVKIIEGHENVEYIIGYNGL